MTGGKIRRSAGESVKRKKKTGNNPQLNFRILKGENAQPNVRHTLVCDR